MQQPDTWNGFQSATGNPNLTAVTKDPTQDTGVLGSLAKALIFFAAATKQETGDYTALGARAKDAAAQLLEVAWNYNDGVGIVTEEDREDYDRFFRKEVYFPNGWNGTFGQGNQIPGASTIPSDPQRGGNGVYTSFADLRPKIKQDPAWSSLESKYQSSFNEATGKWENGAPVFTYHRFWSQVDMATAYAEYHRLID
ncbi:glycoside hydrolase [Bacillus safensis FO-36b] [Bacillus safensis subsp. safensis]